MSRLHIWAITAAATLNASVLMWLFHGVTLSPTSTSPVAFEYKHWRNDYNVVHVIHTRFQQHQPDLLHLGRARLALFVLFCLRTVSRQTSRQFLWIIRAGTRSWPRNESRDVLVSSLEPHLHFEDPDLELEIREGLIEAVRGHGNILVVGSNRPPDSVPFRSEVAIDDVTAGSLWHGTIDILNEYHDAAQTRTVIETGLDADDGLVLTFVRSLQRQASSLDPYGWRIWCAGNHTEWHILSPFTNYPMKEYGYVKQIYAGSLKICVTPGLSRSMGSEVRTAGVPKGVQPIDGLGNNFFEKHDLVRALPRCSEHRSTSCWQYLTTAFIHETQAIRSRTPTSAGMKGLALTSRKLILPQGVVNAEMELWNDTVQRFSLDEHEIQHRRSNILDDLHGIVLDAIRGQCTLGHSCKASAVQRLNELLNIVPSLRETTRPYLQSQARGPG